MSGEVETMRRTVQGLAWVMALAACSGDPNSPATEAAPAEDVETPAEEPAVDAVDPLVLPEGDLGPANLEAYANAVLNYHQLDEFSPPPIDGTVLAGRSFVFEVEPDKQSMAGPYYSYDTDAQELKLFVSLADNNHFQGQDYKPEFDYLPFLYVETREGGQIGSNAFGVTSTFTKSDRLRIGVGSASDKHAVGIFPRSKYGSYGTLAKTVRMSPDEGRAAVAGLRMRVRGVLDIDPKYEKVVVCSRQKTTPTFDYPYEQNWKECVLSGKLSSIELVSPSAGVLATWAIK